MIQTITTEISLYCMQCESCNVHGPLANTMSDALGEAEKVGWQIERSDLCPKCSVELARELEAQKAGC